jgi:hypothetical protein
MDGLLNYELGGLQGDGEGCRVLAHLYTSDILPDEVEWVVSVELPRAIDKLSLNRSDIGKMVTDSVVMKLPRSDEDVLAQLFGSIQEGHYDREPSPFETFWARDLSCSTYDTFPVILRRRLISLSQSHAVLCGCPMQ